jgi:para-nitrobenzyl esterase
MNRLSRRAVLRHLIAGGTMLAGSALGDASTDMAAPSDTCKAATRIIRTRSGRLRGRLCSGVAVFRGIPYGGPTDGAGRFLPPPAPAPWSGVRDAFEYGPPCVQINTDLPAWVDPRPASENCLFLNVWAPQGTHGSALPVMVWIHGGAYVSGSGGLSLYDGETLARRENVVVVTVNHRLNAFGYLYLGGLSSRYIESGNAGQRDLVAALEWVRDNIGGFGGNPGNVAVFGESGGGAKISTLCGMPSAKGLFHKAIIESGSLWDSYTPYEATEMTKACLAQLSLSVRDFDRLGHVPAERLAAAGQAAATQYGDPLAFRPVVDGRSIPEKPWDPHAPDLAAAVPMLIGTNSDEAAYFVDDPVNEPMNDEELRTRLIKACRRISLSAAQAGTLINGYRENERTSSRLDLLVQIATDAWMWRNATTQAERKVEQKASPAYMYQFTWRTPCFGRQWAPHGVEVPFVFGNLEYRLAWDEADTPAVRAAADPTGIRYRLADTTMAAWAQFARTGSPSTASLPWPAYDRKRRNTMILGARCGIESDPGSWRRALLDRVLG